MNVEALLRATTRVWTFTLPYFVSRQSGMRCVRERSSSVFGRAMTERGLTGSSITVEIREPLFLIYPATSAPLDGAFPQPPSAEGERPRPPCPWSSLFTPVSCVLSTEDEEDAGRAVS